MQHLVTIGFLDDAFDAAVKTPAVLVGEFPCGHDYNRDLPPFRIPAHFLQKLETIHLWHHQARMIASGGVSANFVSASRPFTASLIFQPRCSRAVRTCRRPISSSSTTRRCPAEEPHSVYSTLTSFSRSTGLTR